MRFYSDSRGFTLTELMITVVIGAVVLAAATATYIAQNRSFSTQESVSEVNTQSKTAHDMISNDIKTAGFGIPDDMNLDPVGGYTTVITPYDRSDAADALTLIGGFRRIGTLWPSTGGSGMGCPAEVGMGSNQISIELSGVDGANLTDRRYVSFDGVDYAEIQSCTVIDGNCSGVITLDRALRATYPLEDSTGDGNCDTGRPVYLVEDITYCVDANATLRRIRRGGNAATCTGISTSDDEAVAENIEDLQLAYALDADNDGMRDDATFNNNGTVTDPSGIRTVRVSILARADKPDPNFIGLGNPPSVIENRNHTQDNDDYRRRLWQKTATLRNRWGL